MSFRGRKNAGRKRKGRKRSAQSQFQLRRPKKSLVSALQPILETKKFCGYINGVVPGPIDGDLSITSIARVLVPNAYMHMQAESMGTVTQGSSISGNDIFSRYLSIKISLKYPTNDFTPVGVQCRPVELIWGWVRPLNLTNLTTPTHDTVAHGQITESVVSQLGGDFDQAEDDMIFKDKTRRSYNVIGRKKLLPNNNDSVIQSTWGSAAGFSQRGGAPEVKTTVSWPTQKKLEFSKSADSGTGGLGIPFAYPNQAYIPFVIFYNPDAEKYEANTINTETGALEQRQIKISTNSCHWFNDA